MTDEPAPSPVNDRSASPRRTTDDVTCLACGCLCDDLGLTVEGRRVVEAGNACPLGREWFVSVADAHEFPAATIEGNEVETDEALGRATEVLAGARAPVVFGLTRTVTETVREALALADLLGARVVLDRSNAELGRVAALQRQGRVSSTLGEVKNRADVVVFWGADPVRTHPRHFERYSVEPAGRFVPAGRAGRTVVVVDSGRTATADAADLFLPLPPSDDQAALVALRLLVRGMVPAGDWRARLDPLADLLRRARYGAMFFQSRASAHDRSGADWEAAARLVRDLNEFTRFVLLGMGGPGNLSGAESAMTWQGGYLQGVDYRPGSPAPVDDLTTLDDLLRSREADTLLVVDDGTPPGLSNEAIGHLATIPRIVIGPRATVPDGPTPTVAIATAVPGFDAGGTVARVDAVALPVRAVAEARRPVDRDVIRGLIERCRLAHARTV